MGTTHTGGTRTLRAVPEGAEAYNHRYTEADITWLESQDLTKAAVIAALRRAYKQNDPKERSFVGFRQPPHPYAWGTETELEQRIAEAEDVLKTKPRDYDARMKRLMAMLGLARKARRATEPAVASG